jgi:hypothetical protein
VRKAFRAAVVALIAIGSCRQVDPSGGAIDRAFGGKPRDAVPAGVDTTYDAFVAACASRDASTVWTTMTLPMQTRIDQEARDEADELDASALRERFGYEGHRAGFDGTAYLRGLLSAAAPRNPCPDADLWRRVDAGPDGATFIVVAERPDGQRQGLRFALADGAWRLDAISNPVDPRSGPL